MGSDARDIYRYEWIWNFNPRSRMGSDLPERRRRHGSQVISIHAPAWGATLRSSRRVRVEMISIHAPAWGATTVLSMVKLYFLHFNPRSRMGSDSKNITPGDTGENFNPRSRMGSDHDRIHAASRRENFNPRSRMGSDTVFPGKMAR